MEKIPNASLGDGKCLCCGAPVVIKTAASGFPYYNCGRPPDGCGLQLFSRNAASTAIIVKGISKWRSPELRENYLGKNLPAKAASPSPTSPKPRVTPSPKSPPTKAPATTPAPVAKKSLMQKFLES